MHIEKWYADIVDDGVQIQYRANLQLGPLATGYSSRLSDDCSSTAKVQLRRMAMPAVSGNTDHWPVETNEPAIEWTGIVSREQELWRHGSHVLTWNPLVLNGGVKVAGRHLSKRGYVERLTLNFSPWNLGLKKLKWGRFCGKKHSLVWMP
jgi:hypothetical protein